MNQSTDPAGRARLFVALPIPTDRQANIEAEMTALKRNSQFAFKKWVHPADLHITLKFIGDVPDEAASLIEAALERVAARSTPFPLRLLGAGTFGLTPSPKVLWIGVGGKQEPLRSLQSDVEQELSALGYAPEQRPYAPHITVARQYAGQAPASLEGLEKLFPDEAGPAHEWAADRLVLYRTRLGAVPMYEPVRTIAFHAGG
ncbi:RNA 2',3'-cyclic phosphodiesterase [Paenibacillus hodogayensis]|uniref:RNA 2',3'-cyclic phosphodiesterase n=1 Tax=Paenibacillus hodogayensis TaxID=279208 RepID=A0ABV5VR57_9BACL